MRIIPVMDLKGGHVVHAIAGRRHEYRPIQSQLVDSSDPQIIARAFRDQLGLRDLYVADLDAIAGAEPAWKTYRKLVDLGLKLIVDAGIRDGATAQSVHAAGADGIVAGLETVSNLGTIRNILQQLGPGAMWFSLDLKDGTPICNPHEWPEMTAEAIADAVIATGVVQLIVLDLANVGRGCGIGTENLCRHLTTRHTNVKLLAGGGVRDADDLRRLEAIGISGALVASALHARRLPA